MEFAKNSTPKQQKVNGRESIGLIRPNTVAKLVNAFSKNNELTSIPDEDGSPSIDANPIVGQTNFFEEISTINASPEYTGDDSGFESMASRRRANTMGTVTNDSQKIIEKYLKYPNFKWSHLKYFGISNPKDYMMSTFNVDLNTIGDLSSVAPTKNLESNGDDIANGKFIKMRKRSQSVAVNKMSGPNIKKRKLDGESATQFTSVSANVAGSSDVPKKGQVLNTNKEFREFAASKDVVKRIEKQSDGNSAAQLTLVGPSDAGSSDVSNKSEELDYPTVKALKQRIQKSIESFNNYR